MRRGVVYAGRTEGMDDNKARYAVKTDAQAGRDRQDADIFLGLSARQRADARWSRRWREIL
jgi:malate dehydrogenase (oxaloacetate-decarboxylating)(NADP+)